MKQKKSFKITEELLNKIISVAYNDASYFNKIRIYRAAAKNPKVLKILSSYKETANKVKQIKEDVYAEDLIKPINSEVILTRKSQKTFLSDLFAIIYRRPIISVAVTLILILTIITALIINKPVHYNYQQNYSQTEIIKAGKEARYALEIVGRVFNRTNSTLRKEILDKKVSKPIRESIGLINNLFKGEKNEIN